MQNERVLVRDCEGKLFDMMAVSKAGALVYVTKAGRSDNFCAVGVPAEDVFEFTEHPKTQLRQLTPHD